MRHLKRADAVAQRLLETARTMAVTGVTERDPRAVIQYLTRAGYDVIPLHPERRDLAGRKSYASLAEIPGPVDIVLALGRRVRGPDLVGEAARKGVSGVWLADAEATAEARQRAKATGVLLVSHRDIVADHRSRLREAGQPETLDVRERGGRRGARTPWRLRSERGYREAGGGGPRGGGGGRAAIDEKKMVRAAPRRRKRAGG